MWVTALYLEERRGIQRNTSMRLGEFPRAQPLGTLETKSWYIPELHDSSQGTDIIQFLKGVYIPLVPASSIPRYSTGWYQP